MGGGFLFILLFFQTECVQAAGTDGASQETAVHQESADEVAKKQAEALKTEGIGKFWDDIMTEYGGLLPESQKGSIIDFINGEKTFSPEAWLKALFSYLFHEVLANGKLLGTLILLTIFCVILQLLQNAFQQSTVSKVAYAIVYMVLIILALNSFHVAVNYASEAIQTMTSFILALIPLLLALLASSGEPSPQLFSPRYFISDEYERPSHSKHCHAAYFPVSDFKHRQHDDGSI